MQLRKQAGQENRPYHSAERTSFADDIGIFRIPGIQGRRFPDEMIGPVLPFTVRFADLDHDEFADLAGISDRATNQRRAIEHACDRLQKEGVDYRPQELIDTLNELATKNGGQHEKQELQDRCFVRRPAHSRRAACRP